MQAHDDLAPLDLFYPGCQEEDVENRLQTLCFVSIELFLGRILTVADEA